jgi:hypothetical protein
LAQAFDCTSCAHAFLVGPEALSVICPYCDSVYVVDTLQLTSRQLIPPQALIPFSITVEQATARLRHWFQKKRVTASAVPHGMYVPAFTFDLGGMLSWKGYSGEGNQRQAVSGEFPLDVDDMVVPAYQPSPAFAAELQGYNLNALVPYDARYLANWPAEVYETTVADASLMARRQALKLKRSDIETRANARTPPVTITTVSSSAMMVTSYKLILLPLWLAHYQLQGRHFQVLINGQTGQVKGQYPRRGARGLLATLLTWLSR